MLGAVIACGDHTAALVAGLAITGAAVVYVLVRLVRCAVGWFKSLPVADSGAPVVPPPRHYKVDDELAEIRCKRERAQAALRGEDDPKECSLDENGRPPQAEIPDDLKADDELPLDAKGALIAVAWTLGLAEKEAQVESVRHRVHASLETIERVIQALDDRCN